MLLLLVVGCRMYGGASSVEELEQSIGEQAMAVAAERDGVARNAEALQGLAEDDPSLAPFAERLSALADGYETLVVVHHEAASHGGGGLANLPLVRWVGSDRYRALHRSYGALIAEHRVLTDRSEILRRDLQHFVYGTSPLAPQGVGRYQIAPQYYRRLEHNAHRQELGDIVNDLDATP